MTHRLSLLAVLALAACATSSSDLPMASDPSITTDSHTRTLGWRQHDLTRPQPERVEPAPQALPTPAPSDAVVLIRADGSGLDQWETQAEGGGPAPWTVTDGALVAAPGTGGIQTKERFGDVQLHIEWQPAAEPEKDGQNRSNSGVFFIDGRYEIQILDNWDNPSYADGHAAAIYGQFPPLADATLPLDAWQSYDIFFRMPRFAADGSVIDPARLTVMHNGVLVQNNEALPGTTIWLESLPYAPHGEGKIQLQDHGSPVRFRNLWVRRLPGRASAPEGYFAPRAVALTDAQLDRLVGTYDRDNEDGQFVIQRTDDGLGMSMPWRPGVLRMIPVSPTSFELANTAGRLDFTLDGDTPTRLTFTMGGGVYGAMPVSSGGTDAP